MKEQVLPNCRSGDLIRLGEVPADPKANPPRQGWLPIGRTKLMQLAKTGAIKTVRLGARSVFVPYDEIERIRREGVFAGKGSAQ